MQIHRTVDYSLFKFSKENREIVESHLKKVKKTIILSDLTALNPIIVNEEMEIVDGQHRFMACKALDKPIHYVMYKGARKEDLLLLNAAQKPWVTEDYLRYYVKQGHEDYLKLEEFKKRTGFTMRNCLVWCTDGNEGASAFTKFKLGKLKYEFSEKRNAAFECFQEMKNHFCFQKIFGETVFQRSLSGILENPLIDNEELLGKTEKWKASLPRHGRQFDYTSDLVEIYNYKKMSINRLEVSANKNQVRIFSALHVNF